MLVKLISIGICIPLALAGCGDTRPLVDRNEGLEIAKACQNKTGIKGVYSIRAGTASTSIDQRIPRARAVTTLGEATSAGADQINACIRAQLLGSDPQAKPVQNVPVETTRSVDATPPETKAVQVQQTSRVRKNVLNQNASFSCQKGRGPLQGGAAICPGF